MQRLCVLHVTPYGADAWGYGGIPRLSSALARGLAARGHSVTICTTDAYDAERRLPHAPPVPRRRPWAPMSTPEQVTIRVFPNLSNRLAYHQQLFLPMGLSRFLRDHARSFDVAHLHACRNLPGVIAARHLTNAGIPYLLAPNGTAPNIERRRLAKRAFDVCFGQRVLDGAARLLAVTEAERHQLADLGVATRRIRVVPNPIELDEFTPAPVRGRFRARLRAAGPLIVFLGKLTPRKRVDLLIRAFATLADKTATLAIAGNDMGGGAAAHAVARDAGVSFRTTFLGLVSGRDRLELLADADVVVYPSEHEIFGLVPLEALLAGTPVIVANDSGCGEVVSATGGGLVVPGSVTALSAALGEILADPRRWRSEAAAAAGRVRSRYAPDVVCADLERVYTELTAA
jgi:glycosyltransferase involved in cell wall biosynthesis